MREAATGLTGVFSGRGVGLGVLDRDGIAAPLIRKIVRRPALSRILMNHHRIALRLLKGELAEMAEIQRVIEEAPEYAQLVTGVPPGLADAQSTYTVLPEGKSYDDKFVFGIFLGGEMVGCIDLIRGYPTPSTAYLGLLLVSEKHQGQGIGRMAFRLVEEVVRAWGTCDRIRLAVVRTNEQVIPFWRRLGFEPTGEITPYRYGHVVSESVLFEKSLSQAAA